MQLSLFSYNKGFLVSWEDGGKWDWNPSNALMQSNNTEKEGTYNKDLDATWVCLDSFRRLDYDQVVHELCVQINSIHDGHQVAGWLSELFDDEWTYLGDSVWLCNGKEMDGDNIIESITEANFDRSTLCSVINDVIGKIFYWENIEGDDFFSTEAPDLKRFKDKAFELISELENLVNFHMKDNGLTKSESQRICFLNKINSLDSLINGTSDDDIKPFYHID